MLRALSWLGCGITHSPVTCRLIQLTWLSGKTYFYDINNFTNFTTQNTPLKDGWGATTDGRYLIVSDGSSNITWLDPNTLAAVKTIAVTDGGKPVPQLNEVSKHLTSTATPCLLNWETQWLNFAHIIMSNVEHQI